MKDFSSSFTSFRTQNDKYIGVYNVPSINKNAPIGIFDSGVGGLTVLYRLRSHMPDEKYIYFGDTARAPYGNLAKERLLAQSRQITRFLSEFRPKLAVIACNTVSSTCFYELAGEFDLPLFEIVTPAAVSACYRNSGKNIGVIATEATVKSGVYRTKIRSLNPRANVFQQGCPELVPLAEAGLAETDEAARVAAERLAPLTARGIDSLILGCTHFPLFLKHFRAVLGKNTRIIDPAAAAAVKVKGILQKSGLLSESNFRQSPEFYTSGPPDTFNGIAGGILGQTVSAQKINIEKY